MDKAVGPVVRMEMSEKKGAMADPQVVSETIDLVRRSLEIQRSETERIYVRTEGLSRLLIATLAGMIAIIGLAANSGVSITGGTFAGPDHRHDWPDRLTRDLH